MKDKLIQIRADAEFLSSLEYLRSINGFKSASETIRKIVEKEFRKEQKLPHTDRPCGEWVLSKFQYDADVAVGNYAYTCTNCQHSDTHAKSQVVPYCWYCGAKMTNTRI